jgi:hypothetical protein
LCNFESDEEDDHISKAEEDSEEEDIIKPQPKTKAKLKAKAALLAWKEGQGLIT